MNNKRLLYLDSLRGIAALLVAVSHFLERTPLHNWFFFSHFSLGQFGVVVFFIISGMVIPYSLYSSDNTIKKFVFSRFFRLYPAYWFSVFLAVLSSVYFLNTLPEKRVIFLNVTMLQSLFLAPDLFGVYWTLIIELIFYVSCVLLKIVGLLQKTTCKFYVALLMLIMAVVFSYARYILEKKIPVAIPLAMSLMFFGGLWRSATIEGDRESLKFSMLWMMCFTALLPLICVLAYSQDFGHGENKFSYLTSYFSAVVFFLIFSTRIKMSARFIVFLGTISYSIYLLHPFFLELVSSRVNMNQAFHGIVFIFYMVITVMFSVFTYYFIEKPSIHLGRKLKNAGQTNG